MNLGAVRLVGADRCAICHAARACAPTIALGGAELIENARAHLLVALIMGLRREGLELCNGCKQKIEAFDAHMRRVGN